MFNEFWISFIISHFLDAKTLNWTKQLMAFVSQKSSIFNSLKMLKADTWKLLFDMLRICTSTFYNNPRTVQKTNKQIILRCSHSRNKMTNLFIFIKIRLAILFSPSFINFLHNNHNPIITVITAYRNIILLYNCAKFQKTLWEIKKK